MKYVGANQAISHERARDDRSLGNRKLHVGTRQRISQYVCPTQVTASLRLNLFT